MLAPSSRPPAARSIAPLLAGPLALAALCMGTLAAGCGPSVPAFPEYGLDAGIECDEHQSCATGEVCIQGRCYDECTASSCGPGESCVEGVCRGFSGDAGRDAGRDAPPSDAPPDPCDTAGCTAPTPYCIAGVCVACESQTDCGGLTPICDLARGNCVAVETANPICAPCNNDFDCLGAGTCTMLDGGSFRERVCLPPSTAACPTGMTTMGSNCVPALGATCRNYLTARQRVACATAADCAPLGAESGVDFDPSICPAAVCLFPCGVAADCPPGLTACDASFYCTP